MPLSFRNVSRLLVPLFVLVLFGQGCFGGKSTSQGPDGGVWKTTDRGQAWTQKRSLVQGAKVTTDAGSFAINALALDPQDKNVLYAGTAENGLIVSFDAADSWQPVKTLAVTKINDVAVDPKNKCVVYAASGNKLFKTDNCTRDWNQVFFDPRTDKSFTRIAVDWFNPTIVYLGTNEGDIFRSADAGASWRSVKRVEGAAIASLVLDPRDSRIVYAGTQGDGIWKSLDGGANWLHIEKEFGDEFRDARRVTQLAVDPKTTNVLYVVSKYGIIKSDNQGSTWKALPLTTPPGSITITSLAIDPNDPKKLIYTGPTTLSFSTDGGTTWSNKKLPTAKAGSALLIDPKDGNMIYLGTRPAAK